MPYVHSDGRKTFVVPKDCTQRCAFLSVYPFDTFNNLHVNGKKTEDTLALFHTAWGGHHPLFTLNVSNINWDGVRWLKTFWQLSFKPSWCINKAYFENSFFKNVKNLNFKTPGSEFLSFLANFHELVVMRQA